MSGVKAVKIFKASNRLQIKSGVGEINPAKVERAELALQNNTENFSVFGLQLLSKLEAGIEHARNPDRPMQERLDGLTQPVMELKANARMFHYALVTDLANVMLGFLESVKVLDQDAIEIVAAHYRTLHAIISAQTKGDGGDGGTKLRRELEDVCQRYFRKR